MTWRPWKQEQSGVQRFWRPDGKGGVEITMRQDTDAAIDACKAMATHNDGYNADRTMRRAAHIPDIIALKWLNEEGWWYGDPGCVDKLKRKLNDPDYLYLRTAPGRI